MPNNYLLNPVEYVITVIFELYTLLVMLRFLLQWAKADFYNPVSQFIVKVTNPAIRPLRRVIPGVAGLDMAAVVLVLALNIALHAILLSLKGGSVSPLTLLFVSLADLVNLALNIFIFSIIIQAILSWFQQGGYNPIVGLLHSLNEPLLRPVRGLLPQMQGLDLSPLVVIIALQILKMLLIPPLQFLVH